MLIFLRLANVILVLFSGVAFGVLAMTGLVAGVLFPTMHSLNPSLPAYSQYTGAHWSLAAGVIAERIFDIGFVVVAIAIALCWSAVIVLMLCTKYLGRLPMLRATVLLVTTIVFLFQIGFVGPQMRASGIEYRQAALAGDHATAAKAKARFDSLHPVATNLIISSTMGMLALFVYSSWAATRGMTCVGSTPGLERPETHQEHKESG